MQQCFKIKKKGVQIVKKRANPIFVFFPAFSILLILAFAVLSFTWKKKPENVHLWVITEQTTSDGMNGILAKNAEAFQKKNPNVTLTIEYLPTEESERSGRLAQVKAQIEEGHGPDLYLLPTYPILTLEQPVPYTYIQTELLFPNVEQAMAEGYFLDISALYQNDEALEKEALNAAVMGAGKTNGKQYTLPLRYDMLMLYTTEEAMAQYDITEDLLKQPFDRWMQYTLDRGEQILACGADCQSLFVFSDMIDYTHKTILLSEESVHEYLTLHNKVQSLVGGTFDHRYKPTLETYCLGFCKQYPVHIGKLAQALEFTAIAKLEQKKIRMFPIRTVQGDIQATVSYYGAIGKDCSQPELAYEFLRRFLLEDAQWEQIRGDNQFPGLLEGSFPVRTAGSVEPLWKNLQSQIAALSSSSPDKTVQQVQQLRDSFLSLSITQQDIPVLEEKIDKVVFSFFLPTRFDDILFRAKDTSAIDGLSREVIENLQTFLPQ